MYVVTIPMSRFIFLARHLINQNNSLMTLWIVIIQIGLDHWCICTFLLLDLHEIRINENITFVLDLFP